MASSPAAVVILLFVATITGTFVNAEEKFTSGYFSQPGGLDSSYSTYCMSRKFLVRGKYACLGLCAKDDCCFSVNYEYGVQDGEFSTCEVTRLSARKPDGGVVNRTGYVYYERIRHDNSKCRDTDFVLTSQQFPSDCIYNFQDCSCYIFSAATATFDDGRFYCDFLRPSGQTWRSDLAGFETMREWEWVEPQLRNRPLMFLGGKDVAGNNHDWQWLATSTPLPHSGMGSPPWVAGRPEALPSALCLAYSPVQGGWINTACNAPLPYLCEIPLPVP
ncbi:uncharacterized protein LOC106169836 [Lingula anatina]|uniref:Uncharacterized protein LOC106169836 n=1 Tax=Lingula anatina TaxID=7574 RepID=A0A1S3J3C7_LINAN|nr:uncharacterized protein LOC106169836 [Lingula anatina]|eukprot:XP_013404917.1 uncharacterized protein LOC106169836 [Lingula anatina]